MIYLTPRQKELALKAKERGYITFLDVESLYSTKHRKEVLQRLVNAKIIAPCERHGVFIYIGADLAQKTLMEVQNVKNSKSTSPI